MGDRGPFSFGATKGLWICGSPLVCFALWIVIEGSEKQKSSRDSGSKDCLVLIIGRGAWAVQRSPFSHYSGSPAFLRSLKRFITDNHIRPERIH